MANDFKYKIRKAKEDDYADILKMIKDLAVFEDMEDQCLLTLEEFKSDSKKGLFYCLVAETESEKENKTVGYALYYYIYSTWNGKCMYLEDIYVEKAYRSKGIARSMIKEIAKHASEEKCRKLRLACLEWNTVALNLYKALGAVDLTVEEKWHMAVFNEDKIQKIANGS